MEKNNEIIENEYEDIRLISNALNTLDVLPNKDRKKMYIEIVNLMNCYINTYCKHHIVEDLIDINPDCSRTIRYCEHCMKDFT